MLQLKNIIKQYTAGDFTQNALDEVSIAFRSNEFVSVLGPSGSGKTTLLNIIGGLDQYNSGDLTFNGESTKKYNQKDWDSYRNQIIGFIFQNYHLIPHLNVLTNVELALTIGGASKKERIAAAKTALYQVGLSKHMYKKPNQLSGGQMQRVAIARALVNNPKVVLADEPTGSLDSQTSVQIMDLLKEVAKDRLVIMVTHNKELSDKYATRTIMLQDGKIISDDNPYVEETVDIKTKKVSHSKRIKIPFMTSLNLSWRNLNTKKARTFLTSLAGSIGIIGISLIISLSYGISNYINSVQKDVLLSYPLTIQKEALNVENLTVNNSVGNNDLNCVYTDITSLQLASSISNNVQMNNLEKFKIWLDNEANTIHRYIGTNGVQCVYDVDFEIFSHDPAGNLVTSKSVVLDGEQQLSSDLSSAIGTFESLLGRNSEAFTEILSNKDGTLSDSVKDSYELLAGTWPDNYNDLILIVDQNNSMSAISLYKLGLLDSNNYLDLVNKISNQVAIDKEVIQLDYDTILNQKLYLLTESDKYVKNFDGVFEYKGTSEEEITEIIKDYGTELNICGIIRQKVDGTLKYNSTIGYTSGLANYIIDKVNNSNVIVSQNNTPDINVLTGYAFETKSESEMCNEVKFYFENMTLDEKVQFIKQSILKMYGDTDKAKDYISTLSTNDLLILYNDRLESMTDADFIGLYDTYIPVGNYEKNMNSFGLLSKSDPKEINIYVDSFENKNLLLECIDNYNIQVQDSDKIIYTDYVGTALDYASVALTALTDVLIALIAISLIVSCIMIGIITNISVMERTKEIGILRALGASRKNILSVFNAETFLIGLFAGILGTGIASALTFPINNLIVTLVGKDTIQIPIQMEFIVGLIAVSVIVTMIGGVLPARKAARMNPVVALRND